MPNIDSTSSWEQIMACSHPTQPTRYYHGYVKRPGFYSSRI